MANYSYSENYGYIKRIYPEPKRVYFCLKDGKTAMNPKSGYYFIPKTHSNYKALIALLYMVADSRYIIKVRPKADLVGGYAEVIYLVLDW